MIEVHTEVLRRYDKGNDFKEFNIVRTYIKEKQGTAVGDIQKSVDGEIFVLWQEETVDVEGELYVPEGQHAVTKEEDLDTAISRLKGLIDG